MQAQFSTSPGGLEEWRPIPGYEALYEISDLGRVRRVAPPAGSGRRPRSRTGILSPASDRQGYLHIALHRKGQQRGQLVHRLVIEAFLGPFSVGEESNHKNGIKNDNRLLNLEKVTRGENTLHAIRTGLMQCQGEHNPQGKVSADDVRTIREMAGVQTGRELARRFGISASMVSHIIRRRNWQHIG